MRKYSEDRSIFEFRAFQATPGISVAVLPNSPEFEILAATNDFVALTGSPENELLGESYFKFPLAGQCDSDTARDSLRASFAFVLQHKVSHEIKSILCGTEKPTYWNVRNVPVGDESGAVLYIIHSITEVTDRITIQQNSASIVEIEKAYKFFMQAPVVLGFVRGENYEIELASDDLLRVWKVTKEVIGKRLFDVFPELEKQGFRKLLDEVRYSGKPFYAYEYPITFDRQGQSETFYFDFVYQPLFEADGRVAMGVMAFGHDVTPQVIAKKQSMESQQKWKDLANSMPVIVWTTRPDGSLDFINDRWNELTGLDQSQALGLNWASVLHPEDYQTCLTVWQEAVRKEQPYEIEVRFRNKDGGYAWVISRGVPIKDQGKVVAWYGTSTNIDRSKQNEITLEEKIRETIEDVYEKNKLLDSILTNSSNGISVSELLFDDANNVIDAQTILANDAAIKYIGLPKDLYLTKPATYFDPQILKSEYGKACIHTHKTGDPFITHYFLEASSRWLEVTVSRMDEKHLIHIFTDVTPIKAAQSKLEKSLDDLRILNINLEAFAYAASHDLKEPIRKQQFYTNRLKEMLMHSIEPKYISLFEKLEKNSMRMSKLVDDLLEYSQASKGAPDHHELDLEQLINSVKEDIEIEIQNVQASITLQAMPTIQGNRRQLHQLFQNLIVNALKYSRPGIKPEIVIRSITVKGKEVSYNIPLEMADKVYHQIEVHDNGIGFDQADSERMFTVFTRLHSDLDYRGSGIGLSIVKKVVEGHQGFVWATGVPGNGSVFYVLLPA